MTFILRQVASASIAAASTMDLYGPGLSRPKGGEERTSERAAFRVRNQIESNIKVSRVVSLWALIHASKRSRGFQANARVASIRLVDEVFPFNCCKCPLIDQINNVDIRCMTSPWMRSAMTISKI